MKVIQINGVYGKGSTGKITKDIHDTLSAMSYESIVLFGRGKAPFEETRSVVKVSSDIWSKAHKVFSTINGMPYRRYGFSNRKIEKIIAQEQPDLVHLQCINGYFVDIYRLLHYLKQHKIPTVLTLHAEFMYTGGCGYALDCDQWITGCCQCLRLRDGLGVRGMDRTKKNYSMMEDAFAAFENLKIVGVSDWISQRAKESSILSHAHVSTIYNGIDAFDVFYPRINTETNKKYGIPEENKVILTVVPNLTSDLKGGRTVIEMASKLDDPGYTFVIVGANASEYIPNKPGNVIIIPYTESQKELSEIYSRADVFVIASRMDNYPTVCIEANSCGTPVVGYDVGGIRETIYPGMGEAVLKYDMDSLLQSALKWAERKSSLPQSVVENARKRNSKQRMVQEYIELYNKMIDGGKR